MRCGMVICDTREQKNQGILQYFEAHGIPYMERKLETGDYMCPEKPGCAVDRKQDLDELLKNLCSDDKSRFWREIRRAHRDGLRLVILCEHGGKMKRIEDVAGFRSKYSKVTGRELMERMYRVHIAYGVEFLFCDKRSTGRRILEILGVWEA